MIPDKKKSAEEIAALRDQLGIPPERPTESHQAPPEKDIPTPQPTPPADHEITLPPTTEKPAPREPKPIHTLRKKELPLAKPTETPTQKTALPTQRHADQEILRFQQAQTLTTPQHNPAAHLLNLAAHPALLTTAYLLAIIAPAASIYLAKSLFAPTKILSITIIASILISSLLTLFIALRKPRSRHHAAILLIIILLTTVFSALQHLPIFQNEP